MYRTVETGIWDDPKVEPLPLEAKLLFVYLFTNRHSHVSGIYPMRRQLAALETVIAEEVLGAAWARLEADGLIRTDGERKVVWVINMLRHQGRGEKNERSAARQLETLHGSPLIGSFLAKYPEVRKYLREDRVSIGHLRSADTLSEVGSQSRSKEQKQEQDSGAELDGAPPSADAEAPQAATCLLSFPCLAGRLKGPTTWALTEAHREEWERAFPDMDILGEAQKALVWLKVNHLKTHNGMPAFLVGWFSRGQNSGRYLRRTPLANLVPGRRLDSEAYRTLAESSGDSSLMDRWRKAVRERLADEEEFATWFRPLLPVRQEGDRLIIAAPNSRFVCTLEESYAHVLSDAALACGLGSVQVLTASAALAAGGTE